MFALLPCGGICTWSSRARARKQCVSVSPLKNVCDLEYEDVRLLLLLKDLCADWARPVFMNAFKPEICSSILVMGGGWHWNTVLKCFLLTHCAAGPDPVCLRIPYGSSVWLVLMDTTCAFHVFCAWNKVGRAQGSVWAHPFTLPWAVVLVMNVQGKHEHAKYLGLIQTQSWLHGLEI